MREPARFAASAGAEMRRLCIFCGSNPGHAPAYRSLAARLGQTLALRSIVLVYGGGRVGSMATGFVSPAHRAMLVTAASPDVLLSRFTSDQAPRVGKWVETSQT